jgi:EAL domain-containing protein (putative c-di-GMP-specific phosphodiesterase class I)
VQAIDRHTLEQVCQDPAAVRPVFQPIVDLEGNAIRGYELLASIRAPFEFPTQTWFAAAAQYGLEGALEARIVRTGLTTAGSLRDDRFLCINVSPRAMLSTQFQGVLRQYERFDSVVLEVSEPNVMEEGLDTSLQPFRSAGGRLAVDSFGAGFTSLRRIVELRPNMLKLDRSAVSGIDRDPTKAVFAELAVGIAERLEADLVAVGVERREELDALRGLGISLAQGFLFGRREESIPDAEARWTPPGG